MSDAPVPVVDPARALLQSEPEAPRDDALRRLESRRRDDGDARADRPIGGQDQHLGLGKSALRPGGRSAALSRSLEATLAGRRFRVERTPAQVTLRWAIQQNNANPANNLIQIQPTPGSSSPRPRPRS